jgi:hypothetical protein
MARLASRKGDMSVFVFWSAAGARGAVLGLLFSVIAIGATGRTPAGARPVVIQYTSPTYQYSLSYPASWKRDTTIKSTGPYGKVEASISPAALQLLAPGGDAIVVVLVKQSPTSTAAIRAKEDALLREHATRVGKINYDTRTINGVVFVSADAPDKVSSKGRVEGVIFATSHGHFTYYFAGALLLKQKDSTARGNELIAIFNSIKLK